MPKGTVKLTMIIIATLFMTGCIESNSQTISDNNKLENYSISYENTSNTFTFSNSYNELSNNSRFKQDNDAVIKVMPENGTNYDRFTMVINKTYITNLSYDNDTMIIKIDVR